MAWPEEICVVPNHLPFAAYRDSDATEENALAGYNFYGDGTTDRDGTVAICPKLKSTSAAVEIYEVKSGTPKPSMETAAYCQSVIKNGRCLAKFKQTDDRYTTTNTAAILGYYHISRALGDICEISPAVLRTMDIEQHKQIVSMAAKLGAHGLVGKSWDLFTQYYANPARSSVAQQLFTSDFQQIYGGLLQNTSGEEDYGAWEASRDNLPRTKTFQNMADSRPAAAILGSSAFSQVNLQNFVAMRDMADMILLDYLLSQSDRLSGGNMNDRTVVYTFKDAHLIETMLHKGQQLPPNAIAVKKLVIKDTDAGMFTGSNIFAKLGYLPRISHMNPETYNRLQDLASKWKNDPNVKTFFHRECTFTNSEISLFDRNLSAAATTLQARHAAGKLLLDLDMDSYFKAQSLDSGTSNR